MSGNSKDDGPWSAEKLRDRSYNWNLACDVALLQTFRSLSENIFSKCTSIDNALSNVTKKIEETDLEVKIIHNEFESMSNTQFIESRVYEDDDLAAGVKEGESKPESESVSEDEILEVMADLVSTGLQVIDKYYEKINVEASDTEDEASDFTSYILQPKDLYADRPLSNVIGTKEWYADSKVGLYTSSSDSEESDKESEQFSDSNSEYNITIQPTKVEEESSKNDDEKSIISIETEELSDKNSELPNHNIIVDKIIVPSNSEQIVSNTVPKTILPFAEPEVNKRPIQKISHNISSYIFADEPPPLSIKEHLGKKSLFDDDDDDDVSDDEGLFASKPSDKIPNIPNEIQKGTLEKYSHIPTFDTANSLSQLSKQIKTELDEKFSKSEASHGSSTLVSEPHIFSSQTAYNNSTHNKGVTNPPKPDKVLVESSVNESQIKPPQASKTNIDEDQHPDESAPNTRLNEANIFDSELFSDDLFSVDNQKFDSDLFNEGLFSESSKIKDFISNITLGQDDELFGNSSSLFSAAIKEDTIEKPIQINNSDNSQFTQNDFIETKGDDENIVEESTVEATSSPVIEKESDSVDFSKADLDPTYVESCETDDFVKDKIVERLDDFFLAPHEEFAAKDLFLENDVLTDNEISTNLVKPTCDSSVKDVEEITSIETNLQTNEDDEKMSEFFQEKNEGPTGSDKIPYNQNISSFGGNLFSFTPPLLDNVSETFSDNEEDAYDLFSNDKIETTTSSSVYDIEPPCIENYYDTSKIDSKKVYAEAQASLSKETKHSYPIIGKKPTEVQNIVKQLSNSEDKTNKQNVGTSSNPLPGKLKHNLNIDVNKLLPGSQKSIIKIEEDETQNDITPVCDTPDLSQSNTVNSQYSDMGLTDPFANVSHINTLTSITKHRAKIPSKRRPPSRKQREDKTERSGSDFNFKNKNMEDLNSSLDRTNTSLKYNPENGLEELLQAPLLVTAQKPANAFLNKKTVSSIKSDISARTENGISRLSSGIDGITDDVNNLRMFNDDFSDVNQPVISTLSNKLISKNKEKEIPKNTSQKNLLNHVPSANSLIQKHLTDTSPSTNQSLKLFDDSSDDDDFLKPKVAFRSFGNKALFVSSDSDEDFLGVVKVNDKKAKHNKKSSVLKSSLFDDNEDEDDLFRAAKVLKGNSNSVTSKVESHQKTYNFEKIKKLDTIETCDDPLSTFLS